MMTPPMPDMADPRPQISHNEMPPTGFDLLQNCIKYDHELYKTRLVPLSLILSTVLFEPHRLGPSTNWANWWDGGNRRWRWVPEWSRHRRLIASNRGRQGSR
eukprot:scaffold670_cov58-Attheya_sp.AAC.1